MNVFVNNLINVKRLLPACKQLLNGDIIAVIIFNQKMLTNEDLLNVKFQL